MVLDTQIVWGKPKFLTEKHNKNDIIIQKKKKKNIKKIAVVI